VIFKHRPVFAVSRRGVHRGLEIGGGGVYGRFRGVRLDTWFVGSGSGVV